VISGSPQAANPSQLFPSLLQARVTDAKTNPVPGATVTFALPASGPDGTFSGSPVVSTDANGLATAPPLTANTASGNFDATASAPGVAAPAAFNLTVLPNASGTLKVLPAQISFASESGQPAPASQTVQITNANGAVEQWTAVSSAPWLSVSPSSGATPASVTITVNPSGLAPGAYSGTVTFTTPTGQVTLFVVYQVNDKPALIASPASLLFFGLQQGAPPAQTVFVTSTGRAIGYNVTTSVAAGGSWLQVGSTQGLTPNSLQVSVNTTALAEAVYQGSIVLTPTEAGLSNIIIPVTLVVGPVIQTPVILEVTNAGSFHPSGTPGALMTIFGRALSDAVYQATTLPLPQTLGPTTVTVDGAPVLLYYVSPTQINFQMPSGQGAGTPSVVVTNAALKASSQAFPVILTAVNPGLIVTPDGRAAALNQDFSPNTAATPQPAGAIILVYLTGQGPTTPPVPDGVAAPSSPLSVVNGRVAAQIGGKPAEVLFAGLAPGFVGDTQVNVRIPEGLAPGDQPVFITINDVPSNAGLISVR
jgi:adhesin/invasin